METVTGTAPGRRLGTVASTVVGLTYVHLSVLLGPNDTLWKHRLVPKFLPLIVIFWPGLTWVGVTVVMVGWAR